MCKERSLPRNDFGSSSPSSFSSSGIIGSPYLLKMSHEERTSRGDDKYIGMPALMKRELYLCVWASVGQGRGPLVISKRKLDPQMYRDLILHESKLLVFAREGDVSGECHVIPRSGSLHTVTST